MASRANLTLSCTPTVLEVFDLATIVAKSTVYSPSLVAQRYQREAAVSLILRDTRHGAEILFIERARRDDDPWSGQMAFPGGRRGAEDATNLDTAERETREEVGIRIERESNVGRLDDLVGHSTGPAPGLVISCHMYVLREAAKVTVNHEVRDVIWIPVASLADPTFHVERFNPTSYDGEFPGIRCGPDDERIIWGLTYRFLCVFFKMTGIPFAGNS